jgi:16S rRNA (uracil1498-N3)-methyltransferase
VDLAARATFAGMITIVVTPAEFDGERLTIAGEVHRHLFRARRMGDEETLRVVDGAGRARWAKLESIGRHAAEALLGAAAPAGDPARVVELLTALPKPDRAAWLVEKCTELGAGSISFVAFERSPRDLPESALDRLRRVAVAALEQCHGARLPILRGLLPWEQALAAGAEGALLLEPRAEGTRAAVDLPLFRRLWVGPEGGFTSTEIEALRAHGVRGLSLGPRVLRIETAAVVGLGALLNA